MSLVINHDAGFFSCCSMKLFEIINYFNSHKKLPDSVDSSAQFKLYKQNGHENEDVSFDYFEHYDHIPGEITWKEDIYYHWCQQFQNYSELQYEKLFPFIKKYFSPSLEIKKMTEEMENKYNLDYQNICVLFYRGNDKNTETLICDYDQYIDIAKNILNCNPSIQFLIQSDETEFIEKMISEFPSRSFYFSDETRHIHKCNNTVDIVMRDKNHIFSKYFLAITLIMSKCKYMICGSGNCSLWATFYRENNKNIVQNFNGRWYYNIVS